jgi:hypothetical protein
MIGEGWLFSNLFTWESPAGALSYDDAKLQHWLGFTALSG